MNKIGKLLVVILLLLFAFFSFPSDAAVKKKAKKTVRTVEVQTKDELILFGTLTLPDNASVKNKVPLVILLHSLGNDKSVYDKLVVDLKEQDIASLAMDLRGHHQSTTRLSGKKTYWQSYSNVVFQKYPADIVEILDFIKEHYVAIDTTRVGIVGADISANTAILAAADSKYNVKTMVLFSPTLDFKGLKTPTAMVKYGQKPVTFVVTELDTYHYKNARELEKYAQGEVNFISVKAGGTGDSILKLNPDLNKTFAEWFKKHL